MKLASNHKAFTITEMLVVCVILIILATLISPAISRIRAKSDAIRCVSNLRQIGVLFQSYAGENGGIVPLQRYGSQSIPTTLRWSDYLIRAGYFKTYNEIMSCPVDSPKIKATGYVYGTIGNVSSSDSHSQTIEDCAYSRAVRMPAIEQPSKYWLLTDSWSASHNAQIYVIQPEENPQTHMHLRHDGKANMLFADGHVEAVGLEQTSQFAINPLRRALNEKKQEISQ